MSTAEYDAITTLSEDLCNALPINDLFPSLISKQVIDFNDKAEICSESIERRRVELFISKLIGRIKTGDSEKFYKFMEVLKESPKCVDLQNRMEQLRVLNQHFDGKSARESQSENSKSLQQSSETPTPASDSVKSAKPSHVEVPGAKHCIFIVYAKEDHDPNGHQVLMLSDVLRHAGVDCDIDLYHINENIQDWSHWTSLSIHYCAANKDYILLVCSPKLLSLLEDTAGNLRINMCAGHIDSLTLRSLLQKYTDSFILLIDPTLSHLVPPILSGKITYQFPFSKVPLNITTDQLLDHPDFTSLRSLVATASGHEENLPPAPLVQESTQGHLTTTIEVDQPPPATIQPSQYTVTLINASKPQPSQAQESSSQNTDTGQVLPPLQQYDLTQPPSTNVQDSQQVKQSSESVKNSTVDATTQSKDFYYQNDENKASLTDETDQSERKDTNLGSSSDDDYEECNSSSEPETPYSSLDQTPSVKQDEPLETSCKDAETSQQTVTHSSSLETPNSLQDNDEETSENGADDGATAPLPNGDKPYPSPAGHHEVTSSDEDKLSEPVQPLTEDGNMPVNDDPSIPTLQQLSDHVQLQAAPKWYKLGVALLSADKVDTLNHNNLGDAESSCTEIFKIWLREDTEASWVKIVDALRTSDVGLPVLADEIENMFVPGLQDVDDETSSRGSESKDNKTAIGSKIVIPVEPEQPVEPVQPAEPVQPPVDNDDDNALHPASLIHANATDVPLLPPEEKNATGNELNKIHKLLDGLMWTTLTCTAGGLGYLISSEVNNDDVAVVTGAVCGVTAGAILALYLTRE